MEYLISGLSLIYLLILIYSRYLAEKFFVKINLKEYTKYKEDSYLCSNIRYQNELKLIKTKSYDQRQLTARYLTQNSKTLVILSPILDNMIYFYYQNGYDVLLMEKRDKNYRNDFGLTESKDIIVWLDYIKKNYQEIEDFILHGLSFGANAILYDFKKLDKYNLKLIVIDNAEANIEDQIVSYYKKKYYLIAKFIVKYINYLYFKNYQIEIKKCNLLAQKYQNKNKALFVFTTNSINRDIKQYLTLYQNWSGPKQLLLSVSNKDVDHNYRENSNYQDKILEMLK